MVKRVFLAAGLTVALIGSTALVLAQPPQGRPGAFGPGRGPGPGGPMDFGLRGIELSDAQKEQVRGIMESNKAAFDEAGRKLGEAHRAFGEATMAQAIDESAVRAASTTVGAAMADEAILRAKVRAEVHAILTPEQLGQVQARQQEMQKRRQENRPQQPPGRRRGF